MTKAEVERIIPAQDKTIFLVHTLDYIEKSFVQADLDFLLEAYKVSDFLTRTDIIEFIGLIGTERAQQELAIISRSRTHYLVRYIAMRYLIDLKSSSWRPSSSRAMRSDFYASLQAYEGYTNGRMSEEALRILATSKRTYPWDHWWWLSKPRNRKNRP